MKRAVFLVVPSSGHLNSSFNVAHALKLKYGITYLGSGLLSTQIIDQGFDFKSINFEVNSHNLEKLVLNKNVFQDAIRNLFDRIQLINESKFKINAKELLRIIANLNPEIIFIDAFLSYYLPIIKETGYHCVILQTMVSTREEAFIPPPVSSYQPRKKNIVNRIFVSALWKLYYLRRASNWIILRLTFGLDIIKISNSLRRFPENKFTFEGAFHPGVVDTAELIMSPYEFDFPGKAMNNGQIFFGLPNYSNRKETINDELSVRILEFIMRRRIDSESKIIYCSLGSIPDQHNSNFMKLLSRVYEVSKSQPNWHFIISTGVGKVRNTETLTDYPNVISYSFVPQLKILEHCDCAIIHGGLNSVLECINLVVPMLLVPLNSYWDQNGNAARVSYHNMGIKGSVSDSTITIEKKLFRLLSEPEYQLAIKHFKNKIRNNYDQVKIVESLIA